MKIEKLTEDKIRVTLNMQDLDERNIDMHTFMSNSVETQSIFIDMLRKAEQEVGFKTDNCKVIIEALALKGGLFVLTITRQKDKDKNPKKTSRNKSLYAQKDAPIINYDKTIYEFDTFDDFCDFCSAVAKSTYKDSVMFLAKDTALYTYHSHYYLVLTGVFNNAKITQYISYELTEFGQFVDDPELYEKVLTEYGTPVIANNAFATAIGCFKKTRKSKSKSAK